MRANDRPVLGFLHTADVHVETFDLLVAESGHEVETVHLVQPELLELARADGAEHEVVRTRTEAALAVLAGLTPRFIVCTCSTIGSLAESVTSPVPVLRVDRPMAKLAVRTGANIAVVAALESTIEPTLSLLREVIAASGYSPALASLPCLHVWPLFEAGRSADYSRSVADHVNSIGPQFDVVVLAQASMLGALPMATRPGVLASPVVAVEYALRRLGSA